MARRSLEDRTVDRAARREALEDPSGNRKLSRFAQCRAQGYTPIEALLLSGLVVRPVHGPLSAEERIELEAQADAVSQDPRTLAYERKLNEPIAESLRTAASVAVFQQSQRSLEGSNERVKSVASQDLMNRGGLPATTVQRVEKGEGDTEKMTSQELAAEMRRWLEVIEQSGGASN